MSKICNIVDEVIASMANRPDDFVIEKYTVKDRKAGIEYWIANGILSYGIYEPFRVQFGLYHGWRFSRALRRLKTEKAMALIAKANSGDAKR